MRLLALFAVVYLLVGSVIAQEGQSKKVAQVAQATKPATAPAPAGPDKFAVPAVKITGADTPIKFGEVVDLQVTAQGPAPDAAEVQYTWTVVPQHDYIAWPDGSRIIFGSGTEETSYTVVVTAMYLFVSKDGETAAAKQKFVTLTKEVTIGGVQPNKPAPRPQPQPKPNQTGLFNNTQTWLSTVNLAKAKRAQDALALSRSFRNVASSIREGALADIAAITAQTKKSNDALLGQDLPAWGGWFKNLATTLDELYKSGQVMTPSQFAAAWEEIADGLEAGAQ